MRRTGSCALFTTPMLVAASLGWADPSAFPACPEGSHPVKDMPHLFCQDAQGRQQGPSWWIEDGKLTMSEEYRDGALDGARLRYRGDGSVYEEAHYRAGREVPPAYKWRRNGSQKTYEWVATFFGSVERTWDPDTGELTRETTFGSKDRRNGATAHTRTWSRNGIPSTDIEYWLYPHVQHRRTYWPKGELHVEYDAGFVGLFGDGLYRLAGGSFGWTEKTWGPGHVLLSVRGQPVPEFSLHPGDLTPKGTWVLYNAYDDPAPEWAPSLPTLAEMKTPLQCPPGSEVESEPRVEQCVRGPNRELLPGPRRVRTDRVTFDSRSYTAFFRDGVEATWDMRTRARTSVGRFVGSKKDGIWWLYDVNGRLVAQESYARGVKHGNWMKYGYDGSLVEVEQFVDGKRDGVRAGWSEDGAPTSEQSYRAGELDGLERVWSFGRLTTEIHWAAGKRDGPTRFYAFETDGHLVSESIYHDQGRQYRSTLYLPSGTIDRIQESRLVEKDRYELWGESQKFYPNGLLAEHGWYIAGEPDGEWRWFYEGGPLKKEGRYDKGHLAGPWREYHPSGALAVAGEQDARCRDPWARRNAIPPAGAVQDPTSGECPVHLWRYFAADGRELGTHDFGPPLAPAPPRAPMTWPIVPIDRSRQRQSGY